MCHAVLYTILKLVFLKNLFLNLWGDLLEKKFLVKNKFYFPAKLGEISKFGSIANCERLCGYVLKFIVRLSKEVKQFSRLKVTISCMSKIDVLLWTLIFWEEKETFLPSL